MTKRISLHRMVVDESLVRVNEIKLFWQLSTRAASLCKGVLDDKTDKELDELRDEIDLIATMTDKHELREKAQNRVQAIDEWVEREREQQRLAKAAVA